MQMAQILTEATFGSIFFRGRNRCLAGRLWEIDHRIESGVFRLHGSSQVAYDSEPKINNKKKDAFGSLAGLINEEKLLSQFGIIYKD